MSLPLPAAISKASWVVRPVHPEECVRLYSWHAQSWPYTTSLSSPQSNSTVRAYPTSKSRVTMSPGFSSQWSSSQPAWNTYSFPRASLHYQSHASYTYCTGHPAVSTPPLYLDAPRSYILSWSFCEMGCFPTDILLLSRISGWWECLKAVRV